MQAAQPNSSHSNVTDKQSASQIHHPIRPLGERRFGAFNWLGFWTLLSKEIRRFLKVYMQTIIAPVITAALFLTVFALALGERRGDVYGLPFASFLAPGIVMMSVLQQAFANSSSSLVVAKVQGNIIDVLMPPLSPGELTAAYALGGMVRGVAVAVVAGFAFFPLMVASVAHLGWVIAFTLIGALIMSLLGTAVGIWAKKFDHTSIATNFVITPLSFLSGTFYSVHDLPQPWATLSAWNPFHFLIDGFRYGILGQGDSNPWVGLAVSLMVAALLWLLCYRMFAAGYRLKS